MRWYPRCYFHLENGDGDHVVTFLSKTFISKMEKACPDAGTVLAILIFTLVTGVPGYPADKKPPPARTLQ